MNRVNQIIEQLDALQVEALLITNATNRRYLTGFTGSNGLVYVSKNKKILVTDFRYMEQAAAQCPGFEIVDQGTLGLTKTAMEIAKKDAISKIGFESVHTNYSTFVEYSEYKAFIFVATTNVVEELRQIKSEDEIEKLEKAEAIGDLAFAHIIPFITAEYKNGLTENDIVLEIERIMRKNGASGTSFNPIVAAGSKSSLCHAVPGAETLHAGDFVVMDFGCIYEGYCSDMTRTLVIGEATPRHHEIYNTVLQAQLAALECIKPGMKGKDVDKVARDLITEAGFGEYFGHGLGHSVGLDIHENPRFSVSEENIIKPGMVLTVEPGIYIPGFGGVRIEDMVVVTETGIRNLTHSTKELIIIR